MRECLRADFSVILIPEEVSSFEYDLEDEEFYSIFEREHSDADPLHSSSQSSRMKPDAPMEESESVGSVTASKHSTQPLDERSRLSYETFINHYCKSRPLQMNEVAEVHCECTLLAHFVNNNISAYGYIGVSKLCCVGCWFFFLSYNEYAKETRRHGYYVRGSHSKAYYRWTKPTLNDKAVEADVEERLAELAKRHFKLIEERFWPPRSGWFGNNDASEASVARFKDLGGTDAFDIVSALMDISKEGRSRR